MVARRVLFGIREGSISFINVILSLNFLKIFTITIIIIITEPYALVPVLMTLTSIEGQRCVGKLKPKVAFLIEYLSGQTQTLHET